MHATRVAALDLLRGLAAFSVAIPHYLILAPGGSDLAERISVLAVEVFFVLSGFVLAPQILACISDGRLGNIGIFLVRRWMRTVPPYLFALVLISVITGQLFSADFFRYSLYLQNLFAQHNSEDYYPVAWSLSIEEWFYVSFPIWLLIATSWLRRRDTFCCAALAVAFIVAITLARTVFGDYQDWGPQIRRVVAFRIDSIAYGFLLYIMVRTIGMHAAGRTWPSAVLSLAIFTVVAYLTFDITSSSALNQGSIVAHVFPFAAAAFGMSAIIMFHALRGALQNVGLVAAFCSFMGKISYSVYLFHLVWALFVRSSFGDLALGAQLAIYVGACVAASTVFFYYFERPILAARPGYRRVRGEPALALADGESAPRLT